MPALSTTLANSLINSVLRNTAFTSVPTVYLALYTTTLGANDSATEVVGGSYARAAVVFAAPVGGTTTNSGVIGITAMPAVTITHIGIRSAATAGTLYFFGALGQAKTTNAGDTFTVPAGDLDIALT